MATRESVTLVCDGCGVEGDVRTHEMTVDGVELEGEACARCWARVEGLVAGWRGQRRRRRAS
ncbi:hypothetical protein [Nocardioides mesophilus]|uniref:Uncharacterized protein n=1 Tax=Nocardioides mesophilus TaxID=433659 RepID=A0A7G9RA75_9ACTN|nr:hypothetical protein [Nocardioides mesophilus]QNN52500.1 hypothetical protein H9L09_18830 [Nocardioides mesophilus]